MVAVGGSKSVDRPLDPLLDHPLAPSSRRSHSGVHPQDHHEEERRHKALQRLLPPNQPPLRRPPFERAPLTETARHRPWMKTLQNGRKRRRRRTSSVDSPPGTSHTQQAAGRPTGPPPPATGRKEGRTDGRGQDTGVTVREEVQTQTGPGQGYGRAGPPPLVGAGGPALREDDYPLGISLAAQNLLKYPLNCEDTDVSARVVRRGDRSTDRRRHRSSHWRSHRTPQRSTPARRILARWPPRNLRARHPMSRSRHPVTHPPRPAGGPHGTRPSFVVAPLRPAAPRQRPSPWLESSLCMSSGQRRGGRGGGREAGPGPLRAPGRAGRPLPRATAPPALREEHPHWGISLGTCWPI
ncbi:hypothetical protein DFP74_0594 [Nocardiopsis sp. Huas11]|nr:hypothetical protein DFP74_0594 [Nocardiopsis sp. Huas11]